MRIGLIADIHGNLPALETVLHELAQEHIDQIVCLGDVAALGPQPREVLDRLRTLNCPVIMGNTDAWLQEAPVPPAVATENSQAIYEITLWCSEQLSPADRAYIHTFPATLELPLDEKKTLLCYHGSPRSFDDVISSITPDTTVKQMLTGFSAAVMAGGHTHIQMIRRYEDSHLVNVGSVGLPGVNAGSPELPKNHSVSWAEYGVLSVEHGRLSIDLRRTPLDIEAMLHEAQHTDMPHMDWWTQKWEAKYAF
jgi:predicted phosphodiesterase